MSAHPEALFFDTKTSVNPEYDPKLPAAELGGYLIERDLLEQRRKVELARRALAQGTLTQEEYTATVNKLIAVEKMAIENGSDPTRFDKPSIERGRHF